MKVIICEDNKKDQEHLIALCDNYTLTNDVDIQYITYDNPEPLFKYDLIKDIDILFLDIIMSGEPSGIQLAKELRNKGWHGVIILTTSSPEYYPEGFEIGAAHYLLKPISKENFAVALERAGWFIDRESKTIALPVGHMRIQVPEHKIYYIEVFGRETVLHMVDEDISTNLPLKEMEQLISPSHFLRCFRSIIVNMDKISRVEEDHFVLKDQRKIPINVRNREQLKNQYLDYRFKNLRD